MTHPDFFIVGTGRSGTTLARALLTGHPDVAIPSETGFLPRLLAYRRAWWRRGELKTGIFVRLAFANGRLAKAGLSKREVKINLDGVKVRTPAEAISAIYTSLGSGESILGDKTPGYIRQLRILNSWFPSAKYIRMVRHPLDVISSLRRQPWGPKSVDAAALLWLLDQQAFNVGARSVGGRVITVRLEDLVTDAASEVSRMTSLLGIEALPQMFAFQERASTIATQNIHPASHAGLSSHLRRTRAWEEELSQEEAWLAWSIVGETAEALGYEGPSVAEAATWRDRTAAGLRLKAFEISRLKKRILTVWRLISQ